MVICLAEEPVKINRSFLPIPGGKWYLSRHLLKMIPPHTTYVEVFGGGAVLLLRKPPSPAEVYNDIDGDLVNLFRVVRDEEKFKRFYELVSWTLYSREEFNYAKEMLKREDLSDVERAYYYFLAICQSFGGRAEVWGYRIKSIEGGTKAWFNRKGWLEAIHRRLANVQIENDDFRNIIPRYDTSETFFYLDPPYYPLTYSKGTMKYPLSVEDYEDLFNLLLGIKGKALLSGFPHPAYQVLEDAGWKRIDIERMICLPNTNQTRGGLPHKTESLWFNYELPNGGDVK
jgi:DNA adenine methylase